MKKHEFFKKREKTFKIAVVCLCLVVAFVLGCSFGQLNISKNNSANLVGFDKITDGGTSNSGNSAGVGGSSSNSTDASRKIIKTASVSAQTEDFDNFVSSLKSAISEIGGRIDSENTTGSDYYSKGNLRRTTLKIRIPAELLGDLKASIEELCAATYYSENTNDVTESYIDIEKRIEVLKAKEVSLLEMLSKAETIADLLAIDSRLTEVQSELASLKAQKESLDGRIAYSTVTLTVNEVKQIETKEDPAFREAVKQEFNESIEGFGNSAKALGVLVFGNILYIAISSVLIAVAVVLVRKLLKSRKVKRMGTEQANISDKTDADSNG